MKTKLILTLSVFFVLCNFTVWAGIDPIENLSVSRVQVLDIEATINPAIANYIQTELNLAEKHPGSLLVIRLNTPGGLVSTTKDILAMFGRSKTPITVWVTPEGASATSAGAIIASGAHLILMSPGTNIGAATPVGLGEDIKESDGRSKAINDLQALVKSLSETRGRNAAAFSEMIGKSSSFPADEAMKKHIIDGVVSNLDQVRTVLADKIIVIQGKKHMLKFAPIVEVVERPMDAGQRLLNVLAHPSTAYILFIIGALLLYFEFQAPGGYIAGAVGILCLLTAGIAFQVLPLNFGAIALLIAGVGLLVLEVFVTSYGLLGVAGVVCLGAGSLFLYRHEDGWLTIQYSVIFSALAGVVTFGSFLVWYFARENSKVDKRQFFNLVSQQGEILSALGHDTFQVKVKGEIWRARSNEQLAVGDTVKVTEHSQDNLILTVSKLS
mgnify:CR=1 FL=1